MNNKNYKPTYLIVLAAMKKVSAIITKPKNFSLNLII